MCIHCESLSSCESLTYKSFIGIVKRIKKDDKTLTCIWSVEPHFGSEAAEIIAEAMKYNTSVTDLRLGNNICDGGVEQLSYMLGYNRTLKVLDLSGNSSITARGVTFLADALKTNTTLTTLILSKTNVKQKACVALSSMLAVNKTLTTLDVSCNNIGDRGVKALFKFIRKSSLTTLSIANNIITSAGANVLAEALRDDTTLTSIDISNNNFDTKGIRALLDSGLQYNRGLRKLSISNNGISLTGAIVLANFMETNNTIEELDVSSNNFNSEVIIAFMRMLLINKTLTNVNFNNISTFNNDAVKSMSRMFESNTTLNTLTMINTYSYIENYWLLNTNWTTQLEVGLESNYSLTTFETNIVSSKISDILFNNKYRKLYITLMLLFSAYGSIVPSLVVKRIVDNVFRMPNF